MKKLKIIVLLHPDLIPPSNIKSIKILDEKFFPWKTEFDVVNGLKSLGHEVLILGIDDTLDELNDILDSIKVDLVFNLLEQFKNNSELDYKIAEFLETKKIPFTGCRSEALKISRDKAESKNMVRKNGIKTPDFFVFKKHEKIIFKNFNLKYPLIVKCLKEEASYGISNRSIVRNEKSLISRIKYVHEKLSVDCIVEEFIEGEELYIGAMGGRTNLMFEPRKLCFPNSKNPEQEIYTERAKWSYSYAKMQKICTRHKSTTPLLLKKLHRNSKIICEALNISGQVRIDYRVTKSGEIYFLEANPNPNIAIDDDFCLSAKRKFKYYHSILNEIIKVAFENNGRKNIHIQKVA